MELIAQVRDTLGKKVKNIRTDRKTPAVVFGKGISSTPITIDTRAFEKLFKEVGETTVFDLNIDSKKEKVLVKDVTNDPISGETQHVSFYKVNLKEKLHAEVPVVVIGEEKNPLAKSGEAVVLQLLNEVEVEAFPQDLPHSFTVDVSNITEIGKGITVGELNYDKNKVEILGVGPEELVVKLDKVVVREEVVEEAVSEADAIAKVTATKELTDEEKKAKEEKEKAEKEAKEKKK